MERKLLKIVTVVLLLALLTMPNFIYVGMGLVSYAVSSTATSHQNVEFGAELKERNILSLSVNVKREGYFNGEITLENSNFSFETEQTNSYINKIESNKIVLNQINAGTTAQIDLKIKPIESEYFDIGLLSVVSKLNILGVYRDSTEKDIKITGAREVEYKYTEDNTDENVESTAKIITNKVIKISEEKKRVVQLEMNLGLKENNYPIKEIEVNIDVPSINGKYPKVIRKYDFATMKRSEGEYKYDSEESRVTVKFYNEPDEQNKVRWVKQGNEKVVFTFIYDEDAKDATIEDVKYAKNLINGDGSTGLPAVKVTLYDGKELNKVERMTKDVLAEEKEELLNVVTSNMEDTIYKGKLYAGIDRQYTSKTKLGINLANADKYVDVKEITDNTVFNKTIIKKDDFSKILGENGQITVLNERTEVLATIDNNTETDETGNIVIDYTGKEPTLLEVKATTPIKEGNIELINTKTIKAENSEKFKNISELITNVDYLYNSDKFKQTTSVIKLEETKTEAELIVNKDTLSTVLENDVEIKAILKGNNEQYNLFKNPVISFELPEDVESLSLKSEPKLVYDNELKIKNYEVNSRTITVYIEGEQTGYKNASIEGTVIIVNASVVINKKASSKDSKINMNVVNDKQEISDSRDIRIVAPKDVTAINSIKELNIETIGEEELRTVTLQRGATSKQYESSIEVINNNENAIENVKIIGTFPTKNKENNIDIKITEGMSIEGAEIYYSENEDATEELQNTENAWKQEITDGLKIKKFLIIVPCIDKQSTIIGKYKFEVPELLEYNQVAQEGYTVKYTNTVTMIASEVKATSIKLETGIGPILEAKLIPTIGGVEVKSDSVVKNGEVIKYRIEVSNTGSEELKDAYITANIPEGTTLVKPQDNYEYTGASYYKELPNKTYEANIESIGVGEVKKGEYEVRVNSNTQVGTTLLNEAQVKYGDVTKKSNQSKFVTESGDIRVSVKRVTDRKIDLQETGNIRYFAIIENISDNKLDNVQVKSNFTPNLQVDRVELYTGMETNENPKQDLAETNSSEELAINDESDNNIKILENSSSINIGSLEKSETKVLSYDMLIGKAESNPKTTFAVTAINGNNEYRSNIAEDSIQKTEISMNMTSSSENKYVKSGDTIEYIITIKNNSNNRIEGLTLKDKVPESLSVEKVFFDDEEVTELREINNVEMTCSIAANSEAVVKIEAKVKYSAYRSSAEAITNIAYVEFLDTKIATTSEVNHIIQADEIEEPTDPENPDDPGTDTPGHEKKDEGTQIIMGVAWLDENGNGQKDDGEKTLNNIKVQLFNTEENQFVKNSSGSLLEATTNENGIYVLDKVKNGKYVVVFDYDKTRYTLTKYKTENIEESKNSNAITTELVINNEKQAVASTDIIEVNNNNISNINIGLIELKDFAFRLDKYVSRILIQNSAGTTVKEYSNATVAKAELDAKKINGTNIIIEYEIKVTNIGEVDGYVRKIVDYMPNDLKFSSELNKEWYKGGTTTDLYNTSLANEKIHAGESKTVKLTLTKAMTENNTGLINNTAEIADSYNELGIKDSKSTAGNKTQGEVDYGSADTILSIKTGTEVYVALFATIAVVAGVAVLIIIRLKQNKINEKIIK